MFRSTYKNTCKTLFRSMTFWIAVLMLVGIVFIYVQKQVSFYWQSVEEVKANLPDLVIPEHILQEDVPQMIDNTVNAGFMMYQISIFVIIAVTLVINHNHGDQFYEIEKAADVSPLCYTLGRIAAVMTISLVTLEVFAFFALQAQLIGSGGVEGQSVFQTVAATFPRMTWIVLGRRRKFELAQTKLFRRFSACHHCLTPVRLLLPH